MRCQLLVAILLYIVVSANGKPQHKNKKHPVILVPGDGGSQIEAKLNKKEVPHDWCKKTTDWFLLWLNLEEMVPYVVECTIDNLKLVYNKATRKTTSPEGVRTRIPGFGNTSSVEWLDTSENIISDYFYNIAKGLVALNYTRNVNLRGAPYDFRKAPNELQDLFKNLIHLIEETYQQNGNMPVVLIAHSMGNSILLYLLSRQPQPWKDKYVHSLLSLSAPWGGAAKILHLMTSGDNLGVFVINPITVRMEQRSMPSSAWLMPSDKLWSSHEVLIQSPFRNYTVHDYEQLFHDINFTDGWEMRKDTMHFNYDIPAPGVEIHCLHGLVKDKTLAKMLFTKNATNWYDYQPKITTEDGDGTVGIRSLKACLNWKGKNSGKPVYYRTFPGVDHTGVLASEDIIQYIRNHVTTTKV